MINKKAYKADRCPRSLYAREISKGSLVVFHFQKGPDDIFHVISAGKMHVLTSATKNRN
jgi:hypothetical protein